jgi:hypothetical protein
MQCGGDYQLVLLSVALGYHFSLHSTPWLAKISGHGRCAVAYLHEQALIRCGCDLVERNNLIISIFTKL